MSGLIGGYFSPAFFDRLDAKISDEIGERCREIGGDMCQTFDQYRYATGFIAGMRRVQEQMDELKKEIEGTR